MKPPLSYVPALPAAAGMAAGIIGASLGAGWSVLALSVVCFGILYWRHIHFASFFFLFAAVGSVLAMASTPKPPPEEMLGHTRDFEGVALQVDDTPMGSKRCVVDLGGYRCLAYALEGAGECAPGCRVGFRGSLSLIGSGSLLPGDADMARTLRRQGIWCRAYVQPGTWCVIAPPSGLKAMVAHARSVMADAIVSSPIDGPAAAFLLACILGDNAYLLPSTRESFSTTGIAHVLALSGLHVGILASMLALLLIPLNLCRHGRMVKSITTLALVWAYALITGMGPSVMRAAVMVSAVIGARLLRRESFSANALLVAAVAIMAYSPMAIFEAGFQMSFSAVASILIVMRLLPKRLGRRPILQFCASAALLPIAAMAGSGIVYTFYFGEFPVPFVISNILAGLIFPPILAGGFALMVLTLLGIRAAWLGWLVDALYHILASAASWIASWPGAEATGITFSPWAFIPYFAALALFALALASKTRESRLAYACSAAGATVIAFAVILFCKPQAPEAELYIPCEKPQCIIACSGTRAFAMPLCTDTTHALSQCRRSHAGFLRLRGCDSLRLMPCRAHLGTIAANGRMIVVGERRLVVIDGGQALRCGACDYAILAEGFSASIAEVIEACAPDTVLLSSSLHPSRAARLKRECEGSVPCIDLRHQPFTIVIPKK